MKSNTLKVILGALAVGVAPLLLAKNTPASILFPAIAVTVSYLSVAIMVALAAVDYRVGPKSYAAR